MQIAFLFSDNALIAVAVLERPKPAPSVSTTLPCVSLNAKISKETIGLVTWLDELLLLDDGLLDELEELLEAGLLEELLLELEAGWLDELALELEIGLLEEALLLDDGWLEALLLEEYWLELEVALEEETALEEFDELIIDELLNELALLFAWDKELGWLLMVSLELIKEDETLEEYSLVFESELISLVSLLVLKDAVGSLVLNLRLQAVRHNPSSVDNPRNSFLFFIINGLTLKMYLFNFIQN